MPKGAVGGLNKGTRYAAKCWILFKDQFANYKEFWSAMILFPPVMTFSEAFAPHSMDTPIMMLVGFSLLFGICTIF